jgi:hypothetical protein
VNVADESSGVTGLAVSVSSSLIAVSDCNDVSGGGERTETELASEFGNGTEAIVTESETAAETKAKESNK